MSYYKNNTTRNRRTLVGLINSSVSTNLIQITFVVHKTDEGRVGSSVFHVTDEQPARMTQYRDHRVCSSVRPGHQRT
jgi:hypothetical protein